MTPTFYPRPLSLLPGPCSDQYVPKRVEALRNHRVALVAGGWRHTLAADSEGRLFSAGWGKFGQCGVGSCEDVVTPRQVEVSASPCLRALGSASLAACGLWMQQPGGGAQHRMRRQSGHGSHEAELSMSTMQAMHGPRPPSCCLTAQPHHNPPQALAGERVVLLESGWKHTLAVTASGKFYSWGRNVNGQASLKRGVKQVAAGLPAPEGRGLLTSQWSAAAGLAGE